VPEHPSFEPKAVLDRSSASLPSPRKLDLVPTPDSTVSTHRWGLRAALAGVIACGIGAVVCTARYVALPGALKLDWSQMPVAIAVFVVLGGASLGLSIGGTTLLAARRGARMGGLLLAGFIGGALAGLLPGLMGIAGFGSLDAPYAGTVNILSSCLLGAIAFVTLWSPQLLGQRSSRSALRHLGRSALASVITLGAFGMMAWSLVRGLDLVPSFDTMANVAEAIGLLPFSLMVGALLGGVGGGAIGTACGLVAHLEQR